MKTSFEIIQDPDDDSIFYVVYRAEYDKEDVRSILSYGRSEKEALERAVEALMHIVSNTNSVSKTICRLLLQDKSPMLKEEFNIPSIGIEEPVDYYLPDGSSMKIEKFYSFVFDKEEKKWMKLY